jgi:hypothetical protein
MESINAFVCCTAGCSNLGGGCRLRQDQRSVALSRQLCLTPSPQSPDFPPKVPQTQGKWNPCSTLQPSSSFSVILLQQMPPVCNKASLETQMGHAIHASFSHLKEEDVAFPKCQNNWVAELKPEPIFPEPWISNCPPLQQAEAGNLLLIFQSLVQVRPWSYLMDSNKWGTPHGSFMFSPTVEGMASLPFLQNIQN